MTSSNFVLPSKIARLGLLTGLPLLALLAASSGPIRADEPSDPHPLLAPQGGGLIEADLVPPKELGKILDQSLDRSMNEMADEMAKRIAKEVSEEVARSMIDGSLYDERPEVGTVLGVESKLLMDDKPAVAGATVRLDSVIHTVGGEATLLLGSNLLLHLGEGTQFALLKSQPGGPSPDDYAIVGGLEQGKIVGVKALDGPKDPSKFSIVTDSGTMTVGQGRFLLEAPKNPGDAAQFVAIDGDARIDFVDTDTFFDPKQFGDEASADSLRQFQLRMGARSAIAGVLQTDRIVTHSAHWWSKVTHAISHAVHVVTTPIREVHKVELAVAKDVVTIVKQQVVSAVSEVKNAFDPPTLKKLAGLAVDVAEVTYGLSPEGLATKCAEKIGEKLIDKVGEKVAEKIGQKVGEKVADKVGTKIGEKAGKDLAGKVEKNAAKAVEKKVAASGGKAVAKKAAEKRLANKTEEKAGAKLISKEERKEGKGEAKKLGEEKEGKLEAKTEGKEEGKEEAKTEGKEKEKKTFGQKLVDKEVDYIKGNMQDQAIDAFLDKTGLSNGLSKLDNSIYSGEQSAAKALTTNENQPQPRRRPVNRTQSTFRKNPPKYAFENESAPPVRTKPAELAEVRFHREGEGHGPVVTKRPLTQEELSKLNGRYFRASGKGEEHPRTEGERFHAFLPALPRTGIPNPDPLQHPAPKTTVQFNY
jgi:hypothetical protein